MRMNLKKAARSITEQEEGLFSASRNLEPSFGIRCPAVVHMNFENIASPYIETK
jgi:hypothetical protein